MVKQATGKMSAECLPLEVSQRLICEAAARAVGRLRAGYKFELFRPAEPIHMMVEFQQPEMAENASLLPGVKRLDGRRIELTTPDMPTAYQSFRVVAMLARS